MRAMGWRGRSVLHPQLQPDIQGGTRDKNKFSNLLEHIEGNDVGGVKPTTAARYATDYYHINDVTAHQGTEPNQRASLNVFNNRAIALVGYINIRSHIEVPGIKADIDRVLNAYNAKDYATGCPVFPVFTAGPVT